MASEAVIIELLGNAGNPVRFTVADGTAVPKGTIMKITDPRSAVPSAANGDPFAGIASTEKVASDGSTTLALYTCGIFDMSAGDAESNDGLRMHIFGANILEECDAADLLVSTVGISLENMPSSGALGAVLVGCGW